MIIIRCHKDGLLSAQCRPGEALYALGMKPANHLPPAKRYKASLCDPDYPGLMWVNDISDEERPTTVWAFNMMTGKSITLNEFGEIIDGGW